LSEIVEQLEMCEYESIGSCLKNNVAFIKLKEVANKLSVPLDLLVVRQNTDIYDMQLHQTIDLQSQENWDKYSYLPYRYITRVAGGWIYSNYDTEKDAYVIGDKIFVPFNNDMQK
jgi:hypothetical protein